MQIINLNNLTKTTLSAFSALSLFLFFILLPSPALADSIGAKVFFFPEPLNDPDLPFEVVKFTPFGKKLLMLRNNGQVIFFEEGEGFSETHVPYQSDTDAMNINTATKDAHGNLYVLGTYFIKGTESDSRDFIVKLDLAGKWSFIQIPTGLNLVGSMAMLSDGSLILGHYQLINASLEQDDNSLFKVTGTQVQRIAGSELPFITRGVWHHGVVNSKDETLFVNKNARQLLVIKPDNTVKAYKTDLLFRSINIDHAGRFWFSYADHITNNNCFGYISSKEVIRNFCLRHPSDEFPKDEISMTPRGDFWNLGSFNPIDIVRQVTLSERITLGYVILPDGDNPGLPSRLVALTTDSNQKLWMIGENSDQTQAFLQRFDRLPKDFKVRVKRIKSSNNSVRFRAYSNPEGDIFDYYRLQSSFNIMLFSSSDTRFDQNDLLIAEKRVNFYPLSKTSPKNIFEIKFPKSLISNSAKLLACIDCGPELSLADKKSRTIRIK